LEWNQSGTTEKVYTESSLKPKQVTHNLVIQITDVLIGLPWLPVQGENWGRNTAEKRLRMRGAQKQWQGI
jgi:hypothetical protein